MPSPYLANPPRSLAAARADLAASRFRRLVPMPDDFPAFSPSLRQQRDAADTDAEIMEGLLKAAHDFRSAVLAAAPHFHTDGARKELEFFGEQFDELIHDSLDSAKGAIDNALDDAAPMARAGRAA